VAGCREAWQLARLDQVQPAEETGVTLTTFLLTMLAAAIGAAVVGVWPRR